MFFEEAARVESGWQDRRCALKDGVASPARLLEEVRLHELGEARGADWGPVRVHLDDDPTTLRIGPIRGVMLTLLS